MPLWYRQQQALLERAEAYGARTKTKRGHCIATCEVRGGRAAQCEEACRHLDAELIARGQKPGRGVYYADVFGRKCRTACDCGGGRCRCDELSDSDAKLLLASLQDLRMDTKAMHQEMIEDEDIAVAEEIADIVAVVYGEEAAITLLAGADKGWDSSRHPRDARGRFTRVASEDETARASALVGQHLNRGHMGVGREAAANLVHVLGSRTITEIRSIAAAYGVRPGRGRKQELVNRIMELLPADTPSISNSSRWNQRG